MDDDERLQNEWDQLKEKIRSDYAISDISYKTFIQGTRVGNYDQKTISIEIPGSSESFIAYYEKRYKAIFENAIYEFLGHEVEVVFVLPSTK